MTKDTGNMEWKKYLIRWFMEGKSVIDLASKYDNFLVSDGSGLGIKQKQHHVERIIREWMKDHE